MHMTVLLMKCTLRFFIFTPTPAFGLMILITIDDSGVPSDFDRYTYLVTRHVIILID